MSDKKNHPLFHLLSWQPHMSGRKHTAVCELHSTPTPQSMNTLLRADEELRYGDTEAAATFEKGCEGLSIHHLGFQPQLFSGKKYLQQEWKASYDLHKRKVMSVKPTIDTTPPKTYSHLKLKNREEEWKKKVERENKKITEKVSYIMRTHGGVDNRNNYDKKSLGKEKRQQELLRITKENQMILFRLSQCKSFYDVRSWHEDWLKTLKVMDRIAHYPRRRANQQKGQEKTIRKCSAFDKETKSTLMQPQTALQATRPITKQSLRKNEKIKETSMEDNTEQRCSKA